MKYIIFPIVLLVILAGCATAPPATEQHMVISPRTFVFQPGQSDTTVSITHTCTCPFSWEAHVDTAVRKWLFLNQNFPAGNSGDNAAIHLSINRLKLTQSSDTTTITINSNSYGSDSILVVAMK